MAKHQILVTDETGRIDLVIANWLTISRSQVQQLLKQQCVQVNDSIVKANYKVQSQDMISVTIPELVSIAVEPENIALDIVFEDDDVVVINKPSGMVVHPSVGHNSGTLVNALLYHVKQLSSGTGHIRPGIVHRIDKDTSGLLVIAKNNEAHQKLASQLEDRTMSREYVALVHGVIKNNGGTIDAPLTRDKKDRLKWTVQEGGKRAVTHFTVVKRFENHTLLSLKLETGRTHQIRVHLQFIHYDIVGDPVYSKYHDDKTNGQLLHAKTLTFTHPTTNEEMTFTCDLPDFFKNALHQLHSTEI